MVSVFESGCPDTELFLQKSAPTRRTLAGDGGEYGTGNCCTVLRRSPRPLVEVSLFHTALVNFRTVDISLWKLSTRRGNKTDTGAKAAVSCEPPSVIGMPDYWSRNFFSTHLLSDLIAPALVVAFSSLAGIGWGACSTMPACTFVCVCVCVEISSRTLSPLFTELHCGLSYQIWWS